MIKRIGKSMIKLTNWLLSLFLISLFILFSCTKTTKYDYIIKNGRIVDGTGNPWFKTDVGIKADKIVKIGFIPESHAATYIDASGKVVSPGFIDIHTHTEGVADDPTAQNYITQGVTTVVAGNCGGSKLQLRDFFKKLELQGIALNFGTLLGHNSIRSKVMGNVNRAPTDRELEEMKKILTEEMRAGGLGLSTGLKYLPGAFAKTDEVIELARTASSLGGFYASHLREEGLGIIDAVKEAIKIGEKSNIPVQISHHKIVSVDRWGSSKITLKLIEDARKRGIDVKLDQYPYPATSAGLAILFPAWSLEGSKKEVLERLSNPEIRKKFKKELIYNILHDRGAGSLENIQISRCSRDTKIEGKNIKEILDMRGLKNTLNNGADLILELYAGGYVGAIYHAISEEDMERIMKYPSTMHASDGQVVKMDSGVPHPRNYGSFPRILALYVREKGIMTLEEAIRKMTSLVAGRIGIRDAGIISTGKRADIVIFNPQTIKDKATFTEPHQYPEGIDYVFVNGKIIIDHGNITGELPGRIIYGPGKTY